MIISKNENEVLKKVIYDNWVYWANDSRKYPPKDYPENLTVDINADGKLMAHCTIHEKPYDVVIFPKSNVDTCNIDDLVLYVNDEEVYHDNTNYQTYCFTMSPKQLAKIRFEYE